MKRDRLRSWHWLGTVRFRSRDLVVEEGEDALVLRGSVSSFYHKQMAQEVVRAVAGREVDVVNSIDVR